MSCRLLSESWQVTTTFTYGHIQWVNLKPVVTVFTELYALKFKFNKHLYFLLQHRSVVEDVALLMLTALLITLTN